VPAGRVDLWNTRLLGSGDLEIDGYLYRIFVAPHCTTSFPLEEAMAAKQNIPGIALYGPVDTIEFSEFDGEVVRDTSVNIRLFGIIKSATPCESDSFIVTVTGVPDIYRSYSLTDGIVKIAGSMPCNKYFVTNDTTLGGAMIGGSIVFTNVDTSSLISGYIPPGSYLAAVNNYHISYFAISGKFSVVFSKY
jgi:hypothetical protein